MTLARAHNRDTVPLSNASLRKRESRPETQITHTRGGRQSLAHVDTIGKQREQETVSRLAIGSVGQNFRPFSFGGSVEPLRWSAQSGKPLYREKTVYIKSHKTAINRPVDHTGET